MAKIKSEDLRLNIIVGGDKARKEMQDLQAAINKDKTAVDALNKSYKQAVKQYGAASGAAKQFKTNLDQAKASLDANRQKHNALQSAISLENKTMSELHKHIKATRMALINAVPGTKNFENLSREIKTATARLKELKGQSQETENILSGFGGAGMLAALGGIGLGVHGLIRGVSSAVSTMKDFEQANANLSTILGRPVREIAKLTQNALELGRTTEYTASQVTGLQTELAKLGFNEPQILSMTEPVLHFATAVGADLPEAAAFAGASLRIFNLRAEDTEDLLSAMAVSTNKSALNFSYLQTAMSIVGPVAQSFGFSARDTIALLGSLANAGFDASSAATATRNILLNLANDSGKLARRLGGPVTSLEELVSGLEKLNETGIDLAGTLELTDKRSVAAFNAFLSNTDGIRDLSSALGNVNGELDRIADERLDTLEGSTKKLQSAWEGFVLSLRNGTGILRDLADFATDVLSKITPKSPDEKAVADFYKKIERVYKKHGKEAGDEIVADMIQRQQNTADFWLISLENDSSRVASQLKTSVVRDAQSIVTAANQVMSNLYGLPAGWTTQGTFITPPANSGDPATGGETPPPPSNTTPPSGGKKSWSLQSDKDYQQAKLDLLKQYNSGAIKSQEEYDERLYELEIQTYEKRLARGKMSASDKLSVETAYQEAMMKHLKSFQDEVARSEKSREDARKKKEGDEKKRREQAAKDAPSLIAAVAAEDAKAQNDLDKIRDAAIAAEDARYAEEKKKFQGQKDALEAIERRHQLNLDKIRLENFDRNLSDIDKEHKQLQAKTEAIYADRLSTIKKGSGAELAITRDKNRALLFEDLVFLRKKLEILQKVVDTKTFDGALLTDEQYAAYQEKLNTVKKALGETYSAIKGTDQGMLSGAGGGTMFGVSQSDWEQFFENIDDGTMAAKNLETAMTAIGGAAQEAFGIARKAIKATAAKEQEELKQWEEGNENKKKELERRLSEGLMTQAQYDAEIKAMEDEKARREEEMKLKQAKREKAINLTEAIINTATSVTKTIAQWGLPWGLIPAALAAAMGAAEIAIIAKTPVTTGYAEGGLVTTRREQDGRRYPARLSPDKRGFVSSPTILVGEEGGEYVIPSEGMENPYLAPFINTIETARRNGTLRNLRLEAVQPTAISMVRATGGSTAPTSRTSSTVSSATDPALMRMLEKLMHRLDNPIAPEIPIAGSRGLKSQLDKYENQRKKGRLG